MLRLGSTNKAQNLLDSSVHTLPVCEIQRYLSQRLKRTKIPKIPKIPVFLRLAKQGKTRRARNAELCADADHWHRHVSRHAVQWARRRSSTASALDCACTADILDYNVLDHWIEAMTAALPASQHQTASSWLRQPINKWKEVDKTSSRARLRRQLVMAPRAARRVVRAAK